jgi:hypothetical protein
MFARQQFNSNRGTIFSKRSVPRCYNQDSLSSGLVVRQSPAGKNVSTEAEDTVGIGYQTTTGVKTLQTEKT